MEEQEPIEEESVPELSEVEKLRETVREWEEKYLRSLAEAENLRKRLQRERQELMQFAIENLIIEFLQPLDSMESALQFASKMSDEVRTWAVGFEMILSQFKQVLTNHGIQPFDSEGKPFDPHLHEAVETVETEEERDGIVIQELTKGYTRNGRIVRVAKVKVTKQKNKE